MSCRTRINQKPRTSGGTEHLPRSLRHSRTYIGAVRAGLSIVEVLISLAITSLLLTAVSAAFSASAESVESNDEFFRATQAARVSMTQILTEVRRAKSVNVSTSSKLDMITFDDHDRSYSYSSTNKLLNLITNDILTDPDYKLASNVTSCSFTADTAVNSGGISYTVRVSVVMVVQVGKNEIRLSGSAAPRRAQTYN